MRDSLAGQPRTQEIRRTPRDVSIEFAQNGQPAQGKTGVVQVAGALPSRESTVRLLGRQKKPGMPVSHFLRHVFQAGRQSHRQGLQVSWLRIHGSWNSVSC